MKLSINIEICHNGSFAYFSCDSVLGAVPLNSPKNIEVHVAHCVFTGHFRPVSKAEYEAFLEANGVDPISQPSLESNGSKSNVALKYGSTDPLGDLHEGEPYFFLRAQDKCALKAVGEYAKTLHNVGNLEGAKECRVHILRMMQWQAENPEKIKMPD